MDFAILAAFVVGYVCIAFEHPFKINKAATALLTGAICWTFYAFGQPDKSLLDFQLMHHLASAAGILFFLLGAMTIVELIDVHDGFQIITDRISTRSAVKLLWIIGGITFFLSAVLDNLTTTIVMVSLLRKIIADRERRLFFVGLVVIAANAGGAWSPIGDVTTTMLWIGGQITSNSIILKGFLPCVACLAAPLLWLSFRQKGEIEPPEKIEKSSDLTARERNAIFIFGLGCLLFVPFFKGITHLPPFMGMLFALGALWLFTEFIHGKKDTELRENFSVGQALQRIDTPSILFFLGILLAIAALESSGQLSRMAAFLTHSIGSETAIVTAIGLLSAVVDNVPLVAAAQGMYSLQQYPTDHFFWTFLAYATGTGGSALIIGSAAGVAAMGLERVDFFWYFKRISGLALIGYFAGVLVFLMEKALGF